MSSVEIAQAARVVDIAEARLAALGHPVNPLPVEMVAVLESVRPNGRAENLAAFSLVAPYFRPMFVHFPEVGGSGFRTFDLDAAATGDRFHRFANFFIIHGKDDAHIESFVITAVGNSAYAWLFPLTFPVDVACVAFTSLGHPSKRKGFFAYLTGLYCDALAVLGKHVGVRTQLIRSVGLLASFLRLLVGSPAGADRPNGGAQGDQEREGGDQ